jgi:hypothetical protein
MSASATTNKIRNRVATLQQLNFAPKKADQANRPVSFFLGVKKLKKLVKLRRYWSSSKVVEVIEVIATLEVKTILALTANRLTLTNF